MGWIIFAVIFGTLGVTGCFIVLWRNKEHAEGVESLLESNLENNAEVESSFKSEIPKTDLMESFNMRSIGY